MAARRSMLSAMPTDNDHTRLAQMLQIYADHPLPDGDVVLLLDDAVCCEVPGLADEWDDVLRRNTAKVLRETAKRVVLAIARPQARLQSSDYQLWRELHAELRGSALDLLPLRALPAADQGRVVA